MGNDKPTGAMNGWEKRDAVEATLKNGDATKAQSILSTVQDQKLFMQLLASKATEPATGLSHVQITDGKDGAPSVVQTDKLVVTREQGPNGDTLTAHGLGWKAKAGEKIDAAEESLKSAFRPLTEFAGEFGEAWRNKGTSDSITNKRIDRQIQQAEGGKPPTVPDDKK